MTTTRITAEPGAPFIDMSREFEVRDGGTWRYTHYDADGTEWPSPEGILQTFEFEGAPGHVSLDSLSFEHLDALVARLTVA